MRPSDAVEQGSTDRPPDPVVLVFTHWQTVHNHPKAQLDAKRRKLIRAALQHYTPEDLCRSISGYLNSPHHMGTDPRGNGTKYDSIELLLRDAAHIDRGLQFHDEPPTAPIAISRGRQTRFDELMGGLDEADREIAHEAH